MTTIQYLSISTLTASLVILAGCTTQTTTESASGGNTNVVTNTNTTNDNANVKVVTNTNENVDNENTNTSDESGEVDTVDLSSEALAQEDWLTYTNEEHGFAVSYPNDWRVETGRDKNNEPILDDTDTGFFVTYSLPAWKHQDFTPGISIVFETNEDFSKLKKRLEKDNQGSIKTKIDGYNAKAYNQLEIVYEQITLIPQKKIIIRASVDENYSMGGTFEGIYDSIQLD